MKLTLRIVGWSLRASALICMVWIFAQVVSGKIDTLTLLLSSVVWHAGFALTGVALVGAGAKEKTGTASSASSVEPAESGAAVL